MQNSLSIAVSVNDSYVKPCHALAKMLSLPLCSPDSNGSSTNSCISFDFVLGYENMARDKINKDETAILMLSNPKGTLGGAIYVDFIGGKAGHRRRFGGGRGQPLAKAIGLKGGAIPTVVDVTAGLGRDAFVIASLGAQVTLIERSPILAVLLEDGLRRAALDPDIKPIVTDCMKLIPANAIDWLTDLPRDQLPDVIYIDPMYPHRNKSALVKKEMRVLRELVGDDEDAGLLLHTALKSAKHHVTVKRPRTAPILSHKLLNNRKPNSTVESKNTRYDVYVP